MDREIDWKKMLIISEFITVSLVAIVVVGIILIDRVGVTPHSILVYSFIFCIFAMPVAGMIDFLFSLKARMKNSIVALCLIEAQLTIVLIVLAFYWSIGF